MIICQLRNVIITSYIEKNKAMNINEKNLKQFRADFMNAVQPLREKYGVTIQLGNITYSQEYFTTKMTVSNGQNKNDAARIAFDANVWRYEYLGFRKGMYMRKFIGASGRTYAIRGFEPRSPKYPIRMIDIETGESRKAPEGFVLQILPDTWEPEENDGFITLK